MSFYKIDKEKMFFTIGEVAEMFDVNTSLIRFWEKEFDIISPQKKLNGNRKFTKKDVTNFKLIYSLVKEKKYTLEGAKQKLKTEKKQLKNKVELKNKLLQLRESLNQFKNSD